MESYVFRRICLKERWAPFPFQNRGWKNRKRILNRRNYSKRKPGTGSVFNKRKKKLGDRLSPVFPDPHRFVGCRIRIRIGVSASKSKFRRCGGSKWRRGGSKWSQEGGYETNAADYHHFDEEQETNPHQFEKSYPDPHPISR
jgi:hypothetical protein